MKTLNLFFVFVSIVSYSYAQWQQTNGPYGGNISSIAVIDTGIFIGCSSNYLYTRTGGVYYSSDDGNTWTNVNNDIPNSDVKILAIFENHLFAGTYEGVFVSPDNGNSWPTGGLYGVTVND